MSAPDVPDKDHSADSCSTKRRTSSRTWVVLPVLIAVLAGLVGWKRDAWMTLMTEGTIEPPNRGRLDGVMMVGGGGDVRDGFHPIVAVPKSFPPITEFPIARASDVLGPNSEFQIRDNELVLGIALDGEARAYPINMLTGPQREIINDKLGGIPIAATW